MTDEGSTRATPDGLTRSNPRERAVPVVSISSTDSGSSRTDSRGESGVEAGASGCRFGGPIQDGFGQDRSIGDATTTTGPAGLVGGRGEQVIQQMTNHSIRQDGPDRSRPC
jgi:hypothetical protein